MDIIEIKNLKYKYPNAKKYAVDDVSFNVEKGSFIAILGHNGSGKSTLAKLLNALFVPSSGQVFVNGIDTADSKKVFDIRKITGLVFQNPDNQMVASIVEDDVAFGPENIGIKREEIKERIEFALKATGTEEFRKSSASKLSGGQKQRVAIAGVLAIKPQILILDESTAMLDPKGRKEVMDVVKKLNDDGMTVINITHYMEEAVEADRILVMYEGKIISDGTPEQVFNDRESLAVAGLSLPKPAILAEKLRQKGLPLKENIFTKEELAKSLCELFVKI